MNPVTVFAPIRLAEGKTENDLIAASEKFQAQFVSLQAGVLRRELIRTGSGEYIDIVQFRSEEDAVKVIEAEMTSPACHEFFSVMDIDDTDGGLDFYPSLHTYEQ
ncbi:hypothetical protein NF212_24295 [Parasalinivibrio latis]|uniref:hypothetical protein n=1 Tax=Parasalinivibrio latis TaxID=2952610 RepID=UPI0030E3A99A